MPPAPADQLAKVQGLQQRRLKQEYSGRAGKRFSAEVKNSLQFQFIAADLLSAVPVALELIGSSSVAASAADAATIELRSVVKVRNNWKFHSRLIGTLKSLGFEDAFFRSRQKVGRPS